MTIKVSKDFFTVWGGKHDIEMSSDVQTHNLIYYIHGYMVIKLKPLVQ